jgi:DNA invertase Pin-like site-specific DNA recombinase
MTGKLRCAIYTRKSSEEGLEQEFNSLDAQREACEAFVASQAGLGWKTLPQRFDDGGLSGGNMDRPALQLLIRSIEAGMVNVVVVYKIDRLTRSLMDFARIVEIFDAHDVSFVSVTQQFNTTTSMGRLTLNVLLSFAQFEREVTAERIRDKFAASRKKGMWMGGCVLLGYDIVDKQMVINAAEAETVRTIFRLYADLKNVRLLKDRCDADGIVTKARKQKNGKVLGGRSFTRGHLYELLNNPVYIGKIRHKGEIYDGQQEAIVSEERWHCVKKILAENAANRICDNNTKSPSLLKGLVFDATGDRLAPSHAVKNGKRYRYYISFRLERDPGKHKGGWRLPATELETAVIRSVQTFLRDDLTMLNALVGSTLDAGTIETARQIARHTASELSEGSPRSKRQHFAKLIERIVLHDDKLSISFKKPNLAVLLGIPNAADDLGPPVIISTPVSIKRRGVETRIILGGTAEPHRRPDENLVTLVARAHAWFDALSTGKARSIPELAKAERVTPNDISRILQLALLSPAIVERILAGTQPADMTAHALKRAGELPLLWLDQEMQLNFTGEQA